MIPTQNPFAAIDTAKDFDSGSSPPENGQYVIEVTDCLIGQSGHFIAEFVIVEASPGASPVGYKSSYVRDTKTQGWENYLRQWVVAALGIDKSVPGQLEQWAPYLSKIALIAVTKQAQELVPGTVFGPRAEQHGLIGRRMSLTVSQGTTNAKGKYYPKTHYARV